MKSLKFLGSILVILFIPAFLYVVYLIFQGKSMDEITPFLLGSVVLLIIGFLLRGRKL